MLRSKLKGENMNEKRKSQPLTRFGSYLVDVEKRLSLKAKDVSEILLLSAPQYRNIKTGLRSITLDELLILAKLTGDDVLDIAMNFITLRPDDPDLVATGPSVPFRDDPKDEKILFFIRESNLMKDYPNYSRDKLDQYVKQHIYDKFYRDKLEEYQKEEQSYLEVSATLSEKSETSDTMRKIVSYLHDLNDDGLAYVKESISSYMKHHPERVKITKARKTK